jgi:hypothetical protein
MSASTPIFLRSTGQGFRRSNCYARNAKKPTAAWTNFSCAFAVVPIAGFGTFNTCTAGGGSFGITYNTTWPKVYSKLIETWVRNYLLPTHQTTTIRTTEYSIYLDIFKIVSTVGSDTQSVSSIVSQTITPTSITISYLDTNASPATYTAVLSGSTVDPNGSGPFDPGDLSLGWDYVTSLSEGILNDYKLPDLSDNLYTDAGATAYLYRKSNGTVGISGAQYYYTTLVNLGAAARGLAVNNIANASGTPYPQGPTILELPNYTGPAANYNEGGCLSMKSSWYLAGTYPFLDGIYNLAVNGNNHKTIYFQPQTLAAGVFSLGSVVVAPGYSPNPVATSPSVIIDFSPSDVIYNGSNYGILGFRSTAI